MLATGKRGNHGEGGSHHSAAAAGLWKNFKTFPRVNPSSVSHWCSSLSPEEQQMQISSLKRLIAGLLGLSLSSIHRQDSALLCPPVLAAGSRPDLWGLQAGRVAARRLPTPLLTGTSLQPHSKPTSSCITEGGNLQDEAHISPSSGPPLHSAGPGMIPTSVQLTHSTEKK